ncbi:hypothetical protein CAC42_2113 [Sphaceloma murrayae]|uniref:3-methylitaconate isomerase n=1 Tax=Sphaceloma murrayae TaxID=2082308 RepID=A0A2K1QI96_9PEZI|nr:hypothetical protein CAC42_2113 [Sphaceloma murrayae]
MATLLARPLSLRGPLRPIDSPHLHTVSRTFSSTYRLSKQHRAPAAYYRGGTSRALMFKRSSLPAPAQWPAIFLSALGSPDVHGRQLDGLGGGISSLSKVCVVGSSTAQGGAGAGAGADVDYTFAAVGVADSEVDFSSNCGNMTAAVGPFAVDQGIVPRPQDGWAEVLIRNTNTGKRVRARFEVVDGEAVAEGRFGIEGVSGTGARIELAFLEPGGAKTGRMLPTGKVRDVLDGVEGTCVDVGNPCVFVRAEDLGVSGSMSAEEIQEHASLRERLESIRRQAAVAMGVVKAGEKVPGSIPKIAMVSRPHRHVLSNGTIMEEDACDLVIRAISVGQPHKACPVTVGLALATAAKLEGSIVQACVSDEPVDSDGVTLGHNSGRLLVGSVFDQDGNVKEATVFSTARRLMDGTVYWKG